MESNSTGATATGVYQIVAISIALSEARRQGATADARARQHRAELRLEEMIKVSGIADDYQKIDRKGDLAIERAFGNLYRCAPTDGMRDLVVRTYMQWMKDEAEEEKVVRSSVEGAVTFMASNNPVFIEEAGR